MDWMSLSLAMAALINTFCHKQAKPAADQTVSTRGYMFRSYSKVIFVVAVFLQGR